MAAAGLVDTGRSARARGRNLGFQPISLTQCGKFLSQLRILLFELCET